MSPRTMALAYRVRRVAQVKGWLSRMRMKADRHRDTPLLTTDMDDQIARLGGARRYGPGDLAV